MVSWNMWASWVTTPTVAASDSMVASRTSSPLMRIDPDRTSYRRGSNWLMVVLPAPDGPTRATNWPGSAAKVTSNSTCWETVVSSTANDSSEANETYSAEGKRKSTRSTT